MKLLIQIPAYNEAATIAQVLAELPRRIPGVDQVEVLLIDDGCTDDTVAIARRHGVDYVVRHTANKGLAAAFQTGINECLRLGADIIVNTDGDNQYPGSAIPELIAPILAGRADIVIGDRQTATIEHFSPLKKSLQHLGSQVVRWASRTDIPDTVSGFRALSREGALRTFVTGDFSYTVESLIAAGRRRRTVATVPIRTNPTTRASRLHRGNWNFIKRQASTIVRTYVTYEPFKTFSYIALAFLIPGLAFWSYVVFLFFLRRIISIEISNDNSLVFGAVFLILAAVSFLVGVLADQVGSSRRIQEEILYLTRKQSLDTQTELDALHERLDVLDQALGERADEATLPVTERD